jgi:ATP-binding cassette subfamily C protein CydD
MISLLRRTLRGQWTLLAFSAMVLVCISASYVVQALLTARVLATLFVDSEASAWLPEIAGIALAILLRAALLALRSVVAAATAGAVTQRLRGALAAKILQLGPSWAGHQRSGQLQALLVDGVESAEPLFARFLPQCLVTLLSAAVLSWFMIGIDVAVGGVVAACSLIAPLVPMVSWRFIRDITERWQVHYRGLYAENLDAIQGMATLKLMGASERRGEELARKAAEFCRLSTRVIVRWTPYLGVGALLVALGSSLAVGLGAVHRATGVLTTQELLIVLLLARECFRPVKDLEDAYHESLTFRAYAEEITALLDSPLPTSGKKALPAPLPSLRFADVGFAYPESERPALESVSLRVAPGERLGIVGASGAGKSTLVSLLLRFIDPQRGQITLAGQDIRELSLGALRGAIAVVSQEAHLFHGTIRDNLLIARPHATQDELEAAARAAQIHNFIAALPAGYDTPVGERGLTLSGGERQRIAVARALLKDAPIVVFDEATSHLDSPNEAGIQEALAHASDGRVTLIIAHRLSAVRSLDRVLVLEQGRVLEQGNHDELMSQRGAYYALAHAQLQSAPSEVQSA